MNDDFWAHINAQLDRIEAEKPSNYAAISEILGPHEHGFGQTEAFFAGSGGDRTLYSALRVAGWRQVWAEAAYYWVAKHIGTGNVITYVEGDLYDGDVATKWGNR